ncbi:MAG: peptidase M61, partial [Gammaproteobacteria bacterium]|nr:peptidase M61 [Gammaproteobacteria bacterium]
MIEYSISSENPAGHYFDISIVIPNPDPTGQLLRLPTWIPGSYMIRDFAKNIVSLEANSDGKILQIEQ